MRTETVASMVLSCSAYAGQVAEARLAVCSGAYKRNRGKGVYRWGMFALAGDRGGEGWDLLRREYATRAAAVKSAERIGCAMREVAI